MRIPNFLAFGSLILLGACSQTPSRALQSCVSESGQSQFLLDLDAANETGVLRYQFFGQDVFYLSQNVRADGAKLVGTGRFFRSLTGEQRGSTFEFEFDSRDASFTDGAVRYECQQLQDRSMVALPQSSTSLAPTPE